MIKTDLMAPEVPGVQTNTPVSVFGQNWMFCMLNGHQHLLKCQTVQYYYTPEVVSSRPQLVCAEPLC
jgi:hypothetical protein